MRRDVLAFTVAPPVVVAGLLAMTASRSAWTPARFGGLVLTVAATVLLTIARIDLDDAFSLGPRAKTLVSTGIYSRLRHPVYVFSSALVAGLALYVGSVLLLASLAVIVPLQVARARREERVLEEAFGERFRDYKRKTWF